MASLSEKMKFNKAIKTKKVENYIEAFEKIEDEAMLYDLLVEYLKTNLLVKHLFIHVEFEKIKNLIDKYISKNGAAVYLYPEDFEYLKLNGGEDIILAIEHHSNESRMIEIIEQTGVYDDDSLFKCKYILDELYMHTIDKVIFDYMYNEGLLTDKTVCKLLENIPKENKLKLIEDCISYGIIDLVKHRNYFSDDELKYIYEKMLETKDNNIHNLYLMAQDKINLTNEQRLEIINRIKDSNNIKYIYLILINENIILSNELKQELENILLSSDNVEFQFYYYVMTNVEVLIAAFGSLEAVRRKAMTTSAMFDINNKDEEEFNHIKQVLDEKIGGRSRGSRISYIDSQKNLNKTAKTLDKNQKK